MQRSRPSPLTALAGVVFFGLSLGDKPLGLVTLDGALLAAWVAAGLVFVAGTAAELVGALVARRRRD